MQPTTIHQCGSTLTVRRVPRSDPAFDGCADEGSREIILPDDLTADAAGETLCHEYLEIWASRCGIRVPHAVLSTLAVGVWSLVRDNPQLARRAAK